MFLQCSRKLTRMKSRNPAAVNETSRADVSGFCEAFCLEDRMSIFIYYTCMLDLRCSVNIISIGLRIEERRFSYGCGQTTNLPNEPL
jgi:hypothetical protein